MSKGARKSGPLRGESKGRAPPMTRKNQGGTDMRVRIRQLEMRAWTLPDWAVRDRPACIRRGLYACFRVPAARPLASASRPGRRGGGAAIVPTASPPTATVYTWLCAAAPDNFARAVPLRKPAARGLHGIPVLSPRTTGGQRDYGASAKGRERRSRIPFRRQGGQAFMGLCRTVRGRGAPCGIAEPGNARHGGDMGRAALGGRRRHGTGCQSQQELFGCR